MINQLFFAICMSFIWSS